MMRDARDKSRHPNFSSKTISPFSFRTAVRCLVSVALLLLLFEIASHWSRSVVNAPQPHDEVSVLHLTTRRVDNSNSNAKIADVPREARRGKRPRVAFAISITKDGNFQDGAAVLAYSIAAITRGKPYDSSLIAFVHPSAKQAQSLLSRLGYHVIETPIPINASAIKFPYFREKILKNGCCGPTELIKLNAYRLLQYDRVIHMDADAYFLNPIDELYNMNYSLIYTTDPNMASYAGLDKMPVQGGFLVLQPNMNDYLNLVNIMSTVEFVFGLGWNCSKIGWFWGGMTIQGVLPFYYNAVTAPNRSIIVDRCLYNTMADVAQCQVQSLEEIKSAHFTVCQKPWQCFRAWTNKLCEQLHKRWYATRKKAEEFYGLPVTEKPCAGWPLKGGNYVMMDLQRAVLPVNSGFLPDESPSRLDPIGNHQYVGNDYM